MLIFKLSLLISYLIFLKNLEMIRPIVKYTNACLLLVVVFIIGDLYFGYNDRTCTNAAITNINLSFGLGTWLKISAFTNLILFILSISGLNLHKV